MTITAEQARELLDGTTPGNIVQIVDDLGWSADFDEGDCAWIQIGPEGGPVTALVVARGNGGRRLDANAALYAAAPDLARAYIAQAEENARLRAKLEKAVEAMKRIGSLSPNAKPPEPYDANGWQIADTGERHAQMVSEYEMWLVADFARATLSEITE